MTVIMNGSMTKLLDAIKNHPNITVIEAAEIAQMPIRSAQHGKSGLYKAGFIHISGWRIEDRKHKALYSPGADDDAPKPPTWEERHGRKNRTRLNKPRKRVKLNTIKTQPIPAPEVNPLIAFALGYSQN